MVKQIVSFKSQFQLQALCDAGGFENGKVKLAERRTDQRIASQVSEMPSSCNTSSLRSKYTGHGKGGEIQKINGVTVVIFDRPYHVGFREKCSRSIVVARSKNHVKRCPRLHRENAIQSPAIGQLFQRPFAIWKFVDEIPA